MTPPDDVSRGCIIHNKKWISTSFAQLIASGAPLSAPPRRDASAPPQYVLPSHLRSRQWARGVLSGKSSTTMLWPSITPGLRNWQTHFCDHGNTVSRLRLLGARRRSLQRCPSQVRRHQSAGGRQRAVSPFYMTRVDVGR